MRIGNNFLINIVPATGDSQINAPVEAVPDMMLDYPDDGDIMRALGCLTFEAAHFESAIEAAYRKVTSLVPSDEKLKNNAQKRLDEKITFLAKLLKQKRVSYPNMAEVIESLECAKKLVKDRNIVIHGSLHQPIGGPLIRAATKHSEHAPTSSAEIYELASALRQRRMTLASLATYCTLGEVN